MKGNRDFIGSILIFLVICKDVLSSPVGEHINGPPDTNFEHPEANILDNNTIITQDHNPGNNQDPNLQPPQTPDNYQSNISGIPEEQTFGHPTDYNLENDHAHRLNNYSSNHLEHNSGHYQDRDFEIFRLHIPQTTNPENRQRRNHNVENPQADNPGNHEDFSLENNQMINPTNTQHYEIYNLQAHNQPQQNCHNIAREQQHQADNQHIELGNRFEVVNMVCSGQGRQQTHNTGHLNVCQPIVCSGQAYRAQNDYRPDIPVHQITQNDRILVEENIYLRTLVTCKMCNDDARSIVFIPCGHLICCQGCSDILSCRRKDICPICGATIIYRLQKQ